MRKPKFISSSALGLWETDKESYYLKYLADVKPPKEPQMNYMAAGSAFDAFVKAALHEALFGKGNDPAYERDALFTSQVEEQNRDECWEVGQHAFEAYKLCGAYDELLADMQRSEFDPMFEFRLDKVVEGVPLMGFPDCFYIHKSGVHVVLDWKFNGRFSKYGATPYKYYSMIRDGWNETTAKPSRNCSRPHPKYKEKTHREVKLGSHCMAETSKDWADQLSIYAWMLGEKVGGEDFVVCIDQLACKTREGQLPLIRIANHRAKISAKWQNQLVQRLKSCWATIKSGHIFADLSEEDSKARQEILELEAATLKRNSNFDDIQGWVSTISRQGERYRTR